jgi:hypothetical protein
MLGVITQIGAIVKIVSTLKNKVTRVQELRRSNAATPVRNKKKYSRKNKYKNNYAE